MRASQVLSLFAGLVLVTDVASLPLLKTGVETNEEELQFSKRGGTIHGEGSIPTNHQQQASPSYFRDGNSHVSQAKAHLEAVKTKMVTLPGKSMSELGDNAVAGLKGKVVNNDFGPHRTLLNGFGQPLKHTAQAFKHSSLAGVKYAKELIFGKNEPKKAVMQAPAEKVMESETNARSEVNLKTSRQAKHRTTKNIPRDFLGQPMFRSHNRL
jgi:hypothetical protein